MTLRKMAEARFPTRWGLFRIMGFESEAGIPPVVETAVALVMGDLKTPGVLVRIHSQCLTGDVFGSLRCDCREQLEIALKKISENLSGVLIYEQKEGRGIGLIPKLSAYELQDQGRDTVQANEDLGFKADYRDYAFPAEILKFLGVYDVRLLSNNPEKVAGLKNAGIAVSERIPCEAEANVESAAYLKTKEKRLGHILGH